MPPRPISPAPIQAPTPADAIAAPAVSTVTHETAIERQPTCAECSHRFAWEASFRQSNTPGSDPYNPPGSACWRPRTFCPHCGALVAEWHLTPQTDFNEWIWFGRQATGNEGVPLPPSPLYYGGGISIPLQYTAYYDETRVDVAKIREDLARQKEIPKRDGPQAWEPAYKESFNRFRSGDISGAMQLFEQAIGLGLPISDQATIHGALGEHFLLKERDIQTAQEHLQQSLELDPSAFWKAHFYLSLMAAKRGDTSHAEKAYRDARRFAQTVWLTPEAEGEARRIMDSWVPSPKPSPPAPMPEETRITEVEGMIEDITPAAEPSPAPKAEEVPVSEAKEISESKTCPMCAEEIKLEAKICRYCRTQFEIAIQGYCARCHALISLSEAGRCAQCGGEVIDPQIHSRWLGEDSGSFVPLVRAPYTPAPPPAAIPPAAVGVPSAVVAPPEAKKRKMWIWPVALVVVGGLALGGFFRFFPPSQRRGTQETPTSSIAGAAPTAMLPPAPTKIIKPTQTPEPAPIPEWVQGFVAPLLYYINNVPPDFLDDFSHVRGEWGELQPGVSISNGVLRMDLTKSDTWIGGPIQGRDAAIQFAFTPIGASKDAMVQLFLRLTEDGSFYALAFQVQNGTWRVEKHYGGSGDVSLMAEGQSDEMGINQATKVLVIAQGDQISVFMNDQPLAYLEDDEFKGDWNSININSGDGHTAVEFAYLRFWRLTSFEEFADPILNALVDIPPHLASDFSSAAGGVYTWNCTDIIQCEIADGVMRLNVDQVDGIDLSGEPLKAKDFVLEIEVHPTEIATDSVLSFRFASSQAGFYSFGIGFASGGWDMNRYWSKENKSEIFAEGTTNPVLQGSWARFRFIAYNDQYAVYLNDAPLFCFRDSTFNGDKNEFGLHSGQGLMVIEFDNAKLWDLSKVGNLP